MEVSGFQSHSMSTVLNLSGCEQRFRTIRRPFPTDFHVCDYEGQSGYLCVISAAPATVAYARGQGIILDNNYQTVKTVHSGNGRAANDQHEFNVLPGGKSALIEVYQPVQYDMSAYGVTKELGVGRPKLESAAS